MHESPVWFQVLSFFLMATPLVAAATVFTSWLRTKLLSDSVASVASLETPPYQSYDAFRRDVRDVERGSPVQEIVERCQGKIPEEK